MLLGFYKASSGNIFIDNQNYYDCSLKSIRNKIGLVQQNVLMFDGTIKENLCLGKKNTSIKEIENVCKAAGIWNFIINLPNKIDTVLGKNGIDLSGGQKQRLSIARIYLRNPKILIFDEATSALDTETETIIHQAWKDILKNRTAIVIAHRLSSVMLCDQVAIMENGQIIKTGSPKELLDNCKIFNELFAIDNTNKEVINV